MQTFKNGLYADGKTSKTTLITVLKCCAVLILQCAYMSKYCIIFYLIQHVMIK